MKTTSHTATGHSPGKLAHADLPIGDLKPCKRNARRHSDKQIDLIARSIREFGFVNPVLIDGANAVIAGHGRYEAAKRLGLTTVPTIKLEHLTEAQVRAYRIADNRIADLSDWDEDLLRLEILDLVELEASGEISFDVSLTGFDTPALDILLEGDKKAAASPPEMVELPDPETQAVCKVGELWQLGAHRLYCGDALEDRAHEKLLAGEACQMVFTDPPYNVKISKHVSGTGRHREFAMASGEMSSEDFQHFLLKVLAWMKRAAIDGAILMVCMDWRHIEELLAAGREAGLALQNICVWNKSNGGMGSFYRSKHEFICVFKKGKAPHVNNIELGRHGRYRTNVWDYAGVNTFRKGRDKDLADHPTVKPTALIADAIYDVSHRGDLVLDNFGGSGSTMLAAEKTGRRARLIEIDPLYCDVAIRRWQELTGKQAVLLATGELWDTRAAALARVADVDPEISADTPSNQGEEHHVG